MGTWTEGKSIRKEVGRIKSDKLYEQGNKKNYESACK